MLTEEQAQSCRPKNGWTRNVFSRPKEAISRGVKRDIPSFKQCPRIPLFFFSIISLPLLSFSLLTRSCSPFKSLPLAVTQSDSSQTLQSHSNPVVISCPRTARAHPAAPDVRCASPRLRVHRRARRRRLPRVPHLSCIFPRLVVVRVVLARRVVVRSLGPHGGCARCPRPAPAAPPASALQPPQQQQQQRS